MEINKLLKTTHCHICLATEDLLLPYSVSYSGKLIYRCKMGHDYDDGWSFIHPLTGLPWRIPRSEEWLKAEYEKLKKIDNDLQKRIADTQAIVSALVLGAKAAYDSKSWYQKKLYFLWIKWKYRQWK